MFERRIVVVRNEAMTDADLKTALKVQKEHHVLQAVREIERRLELELIDEAFAGKPEERLRNLARMEGARELAALVDEWREKAVSEK